MSRLFRRNSRSRMRKQCEWAGDVVVQPLHLEQHDAEVTRAIGHDRPPQRFERLAVGHRVAGRRVSGDALGQLQPGDGSAPLEELLRALVGVVEARAHVDDGLADDGEAEMPRLDDARVYGPDGDLVDALAAHFHERKGPPVIGKLPRPGVLPQGEEVGGPEAVAHERTRVGVAHRGDAEEVVDLLLEERSGVMESAERGDGGLPGRQGLARLEEPVLARVRVEVVHLEGVQVATPVIGDHETEVGAEVRAEHLREPECVARPDRAVYLPAADNPRLRQARAQRGDDRLEVSHRPAISTILSRSSVIGAGTAIPRPTSIVAHATSGTTAQPPLSPRRIPAGAGP